MDWDRAVQDGLIHADCILVIMSPSSMNSRNVMDEVSFAFDENKTIIPVLYQDCDILFRLRRVQSIDFRNDYASGLQKLLTTLLPLGPVVPPEPVEDEVRRIRLMLLAAHSSADLRRCLEEAEALKNKHPNDAAVLLLYSEVLEAVKLDQRELHRTGADEAQWIKKRPLTPRLSISTRWIAASSAVVLLAVVTYVWYRYQPVRTIPSSTTSAALNPPSETNTLVQPQSPPPVSTSTSSANGLAQPSWKDIESRVKNVYYSVAEMKKSGAFLCTKDPKGGSICHQDVEVIEQGADQTRTVTPVTVYYRHTNGQWQFLKLEEQH